MSTLFSMTSVKLARSIVASFCLLLLSSHVSLGETYPPQVGTLQFGHGLRLTDSRGMTLYQFENDLREPGKSTCYDDCAIKNPPFLASDIPAQLPGDWSLITRDDGAQQWAFNGMPLYRSIRDSHKGADYGQGLGWNAAFITITTPPELSVASSVLGHVLASANGLTVYVARQENESQIVECNEDCLKTWTPVTAPWAAADYGDFSVHSRTDGVYQWAYKGKPLFVYSGDSETGDLNGHNVDGIWNAVILEPAPPVPDWTKVAGSDGGPLYADSNGMTLYTFYEDQNAIETAYQGGNHCDEACLDKYWTPVSAQVKESPIGYWSVIERKDRSLQWAYMGRPLYTLDLETRPGQLYYTTFRQFQWMKPIMYELPALQGVFF